MNSFILCQRLIFTVLLSVATSSAPSDLVVVVTSNDPTVISTVTRTWVTCPENHGATISVSADGCMITPAPELFVLVVLDSEDSVEGNATRFGTETVTETINGTSAVVTVPAQTFYSKTQVAQGNSKPNTKTTKKP